MITKVLSLTRIDTENNTFMKAEIDDSNFNVEAVNVGYFLAEKGPKVALEGIRGAKGELSANLQAVILGAAMYADDFASGKTRAQKLNTRLVEAYAQSRSRDNIDSKREVKNESKEKGLGRNEGPGLDDRERGKGLGL